jgi:alpha-ribazole phosphatase
VFFSKHHLVTRSSNVTLPKGSVWLGQASGSCVTLKLRRTPFDVALTSPRARTRRTAEAVLAGRGVPLVADERWRESDHGRWEGLTYAEVVARFPAEARARFADGLHGRALGGESLAEVAARVAAGWQALLDEQRGGRILVVTHATPIQLVLCLLNGTSPAEHWRWRIDLGSITAIDVYGAAAIIRMVNEVARLAPPTPRSNAQSPQ